MSAGRYGMRSSRFLTTAARWPALPAARFPRPFFMFAQTPSTGTDGRIGSLQARKHLSDLDRPECGPGRGP
jgi:hypothetical protein